MKTLNIEYDFQIKSQEEDDNYFTFEGYGSTKDIDLVKDIVEPTAFDESLSKQMPKMLWQHDQSNPIGIYTEARADTKGVKVTGKMPKEDEFVRGRVIPQMKIGSISSMSIGFRVRESDYDDEKGIRTIKKADLMEISLVTFPANPEARITALKSWAESADDKIVNSRSKMPSKMVSRDYRWDASAAEKRVRAWAGDEQNEKYKQAFLWLGSDNDEIFTTHKLQIADVIDNSLQIVPRAVFAARGILAGARGGVDIPNADKEKAKNIVNTLYNEMDLDEPFKDGDKTAPYCKSELKGLTKGILSDVIRREILSKDAADYVAEVILADCKGEGSSVEKSLDDLLITLKKMRRN